MSTRGGGAGSTPTLALHPQTSGGLLVAIAPTYAAGLLSDGRREVGQVLDGAPSVVLAVEQELDEASPGLNS